MDDDPLDTFNTRRAIARMLQVVEVTEAVDGRDALDQLRRGRPGQAGLVVVTDLTMPRMSGLDLVSAIRRDPQLAQLAVVVLTASTVDSDRQAAFATGANGYFCKSSKPSHLDDVVAWLRDYSERRRTGPDHPC